MTDIGTILNAKAIAIGRLAVEATTAAGSGHPTTALSLAHIVAVLMYRVMRWDPKDPGQRGADRLVLSEGHAVPIVYAACADLGVTIAPDGARRAMTRADLMSLRDIASPIDGHPNPALGFPFFDAATGSLGQGLSVAGGLGAAARLDGLGKRIYCIIGDGESREGQIWEAMDFIADQRLDNVVAIFNCNTLGQSDFVAPAQDWHHLERKAAAFGWKTEVIDGHDPAAIEAAVMARAQEPVAVIARTVKGWGVPNLGGMGHHGTPVKKEDLPAVLAELEARARELGADKVAADEMARALAIAPPQAAPRAPAARTAADFSAALASDGALAKSVRDKKALSPRRAYGMALKALGDANNSVVALDGDVKNSTYADAFAKAHPARYFEGRIAEQNMVSAASGLAAAGKIAFVSTFGRFVERAFDEVEMAVIGGLPVKLVGTHIGVTLAADGPSQMGLADIAFMRALTHASDAKGRRAMTVLTPADAVSAYTLVLAMAAHDGAAYLRAVRGDLPLLYRDGDKFPLGQAKILRRASGPRRSIVLVAAGYMVHSCLAAADTLERSGISAGVVDAYCLPFATAPVFEMARRAGCAVLTVEDNYVGGLGSELAEAAAAEGAGITVTRLAVCRIPKSGRTAEDVLGYVRLSVADIVSEAERLARPVHASADA
jgi:transketolase